MRPGTWSPPRLIGPAVTGDGLPGRGQPEAETAMAAVPAGETGEEPLGIRRVEPGAVVAAPRRPR